MSSDDYVNIRQIGKGAFGTAHIVQHKVTGERFVLKRVRLARQSAKERQSSVRELLLLSNLRHRNVLEFKGCWIEGGCNLCMLVELCESGDLLTQLRLRHPNSIHFDEEHLHEMAVQLLSAVAYLHRSNIAHRDLKTANILITGEGCLKLADFGLSTVLEPETNRLTKTIVGTPNYMSPCVLQEKPYGTPNDIWGLGCVLFELSALKPAFQAFNMAGLIKKVTTAATPAVPSCYSEHWRTLVRAMLTKEPDMRPSAEELLELDWLQPAVRRVTARFGPELPPGAPELLERLSDLPPDIMQLMDTFLTQEREEKRRADEARERRRAAVAKWDPLARAAAAAAAHAAAAGKQPKLPPLKPHVARKPLPRVFRGVPGGPGQANAGGGGTRPVGVPPLVHCAGGGGGGGGISPRGGVISEASAADGSDANGAELGAEQLARIRSHRPSSAPPDSPVRRTRRGGGADGVSASGLSGTDPWVGGLGDDDDDDDDCMNRPCNSHHGDFCGEDSAWAPQTCPQQASTSSPVPSAFAGPSPGQPPAAGLRCGGQEDGSAFRAALTTQDDGSSGSSSDSSGAGVGADVSGPLRHSCPTVSVASILPRRANSETMCRPTAAGAPSPKALHAAQTEAGGASPSALTQTVGVEAPPAEPPVAVVVTVVASAAAGSTKAKAASPKSSAVTTAAGAAAAARSKAPGAGGGVGVRAGAGAGGRRSSGTGYSENAVTAAAARVVAAVAARTAARPAGAGRGGGSGSRPASAGGNRAGAAATAAAARRMSGTGGADAGGGGGVGRGGGAGAGATHGSQPAATVASSGGGRPSFLPSGSRPSSARQLALQHQQQQRQQQHQQK